jgi:hypothetical protein
MVALMLKNKINQMFGFTFSGGKLIKFSQPTLKLFRQACSYGD